tara:strand:- start:816 stop:1046 length:231 start_codon:yes stop_codon:yes gene_type:complete
MAYTVRFDNKFVEIAKIHAKATKRSIPKQIEYWAEIGRIIEANEDLDFQFIRGIALSKAEADAGALTKYVRRTSHD